MKFASFLAAASIAMTVSVTAPAMAATVTIDFSTAPDSGAIGTSTATWNDVSGFSVTATSSSTGSGSYLTQNVLLSTGIGVHTPGERFIFCGDCDLNELDGTNNDEWISLAFGGGFNVELKSLVLNLVDSTDDIFNVDTNAELSINGGAPLGNGFVVDGIVAGGVASCSGGIGGYGMSCDIDLSGVGGLTALTALKLGATTDDDSYLWRSVTFEITERNEETGITPLPAALPMFAAGLGLVGGVGFWRRRKAMGRAA